MKKNRNFVKIMLTNSNYFNSLENYRANTSNLSKIKYNALKTSNIINEYKKLSKKKFKPNLKLNKTEIYKRNNTNKTNR